MLQTVGRVSSPESTAHRRPVPYRKAPRREVVTVGSLTPISRPVGVFDAATVLTGGRGRGGRGKRGQGRIPQTSVTLRRGRVTYSCAGRPRQKYARTHLRPRHCVIRTDRRRASNTVGCDGWTGRRVVGQGARDREKRGRRVVRVSFCNRSPRRKPERVTAKR